MIQFLAKILVAPLIFWLTLAGYQVPTQAPQSAIVGSYNPTGGGTYRLQSSVGTTDTTITLSSFKEPISNIPYTMTYLSSSIEYGTLDPQQPTRSEFISFTGITQNTDGTAQLTGVVRGLGRSYPYTASTTLEQPHSGQSIFILSNTPEHYEQYANVDNAQLIPGAWVASSTNPWSYDQAFGVTSSSTSTVFPYVSWVFNNFLDLYDSQSVSGLKMFTTLPQSSVAPTTGNQFVNKTYADGLALAGSPNADTATKGISQEATIAQINSHTDVGSTGAKLIFTPQDFSNSNFASTTLVFATSSTDYRIISLSSNQKVLVWGASTNGSVAATLAYRFATDLSTTTIMSVSGNGGGSNQQTVPTFGLISATSTANTVTIGLTGGAPDYMLTMTTY